MSPARGACRVDGQRLARQGLDLVDVAVDHQHAGGGAEREAGRQRGVGDDGAHAGIREDVLDALARELGVDRHVAGAGLQDAEQGREQQVRFRQVEADQAAAADAAGAQPVRDLVGELVELLVAQLFPERLDGRPRRTARDLGLEEFVQENRLPGADSRAGGRGIVLRADIDERHSDHLHLRKLTVLPALLVLGSRFGCW